MNDIFIHSFEMPIVPFIVLIDLVLLLFNLKCDHIVFEAQPNDVVVNGFDDWVLAIVAAVARVKRILMEGSSAGFHRVRRVGILLWMHVIAGVCRNDRTWGGGRQRQIPRLVQRVELFFGGKFQRSFFSLGMGVDLLEGQDVSDPVHLSAGLADGDAFVRGEHGQIFHQQNDLAGKIVHRAIPWLSGGFFGWVGALLFSQAKLGQDLLSHSGPLLFLDGFLDGESRLNSCHHVPDGVTHGIGVYQQPVIGHKFRNGLGSFRGSLVLVLLFLLFLLFLVLCRKLANLVDDFRSCVVPVAEGRHDPLHFVRDTCRAARRMMAVVQFRMGVLVQEFAQTSLLFILLCTVVLVNAVVTGILLDGVGFFGGCCVFHVSGGKRPGEAKIDDRRLVLGTELFPFLR